MSSARIVTNKVVKMTMFIVKCKKDRRKKIKGQFFEKAVSLIRQERIGGYREQFFENLSSVLKI